MSKEKLSEVQILKISIDSQMAEFRMFPKFQDCCCNRLVSLVRYPRCSFRRLQTGHDFFAKPASDIWIHVLAAANHIRKRFKFIRTGPRVNFCQSHNSEVGG